MSSSLLEQSTELKKTLDLLSPVHIEEQDSLSGTLRRHTGEDIEHVCPLQVCHLPSTQCGHLRGISWISLWENFNTASLSSLVPQASLEVRGEVESYQLSNHLVFLALSLILKLFRDPVLSHLISIDSDVVKRNSYEWGRHPNTQEAPRVLEGLCHTDTWDKDQIWFCILPHYHREL